MAESEEELKNFLMKVKEESGKKKKNWLKAHHSENEDYGIQSHYFVANRWRNNGNSDRLYFLGLQNADGGFSHEIKRHLLLGRETMKKPKQHIKKQRHYFADKAPPSQSYGFFQ